MPEPMRILVVDDDPGSQLLVARLLRANGFAVDGVADGNQAVEAAARQKYDVILMDIVMPEMNGLEAARKIRALDQGVVIVAVTGYDSPAVRQSCKDAQMAAVLAKPVTPYAILKLLGGT